MRIKAIVCLVIAAFALDGASQAAEIRLARQFSMGYLQLNVMEHQQLIEKHAKALGLNDVKVSWFTFNGPTAVNEALISGNIDVASGGMPGLLVLWARTKGTPQEVRGISALSSQPFLLNSRDPAIKTIKDFKDSDRIAVPAVRSSVQAITLQMAAAKEYGIKGLRHARSAHGVDDAAGRHCRAAQGRRADFRRVQRAAVPEPATRGPRGPHRAQFVRRDGRLAHLHRCVGAGKIPRRKPRALQGAACRAEGSHRHRQQGQDGRRRLCGSRMQNRNCHSTW